MIITTGSLKGGVGKSTVTVNVAAELTRLGYKVMVVDSDPIATTSRWIEDREQRSPDLSVIPGIQKRDPVRQTLIEFDSVYDYVLVDVGGYDSPEMRNAAITSDLLVVPMKPSPPDLDVLPQFVDLVSLILDFNPQLSVRGLFTQAPTHATSRKLGDSKSILTDYPELPLFNTTIHQRSAYMDVMPLGRGVVEGNASKAKAEIQVLVQEMITNG